jgi:NTE family protein
MFSTHRAAELREIFLSFDFGRPRDKNGLGRVPVLGPALNLLLAQGLYQGDEMHRALTELLGAKGVRTFADLRRRHPDGSGWEDTAQVVAADLSKFPVWIANALEGTNRPILGLRLTKDERPAGTRRRGLRATFGFISSVARTMVEAHDRSRLEDLGHTRVIDIPTLGVGTAEFDLSRERKLALYESGHAAERHAERFLPVPIRPTAATAWAS